MLLETSRRKMYTVTMTSPLLYALAISVIVAGGRCQTTDGCPEGAILLNSKVCVTVTSPGTWFDSISACPFPATNSNEDETEDVVSYDPQPGDEDAVLMQNGVKEVWWFEKDSLLYGEEINNIQGIPSWGQPHLSLFEKQTYASSLLSRWKYLNSTSGACYTYNLELKHINLRSCSEESSDLKFPAVCWSWRSRSDTKNDNRCLRGFTTARESSNCIKIFAEYDIGYKPTRSEAKSMCSSLGPAVNLLQIGNTNFSANSSSLGCDEVLIRDLHLLEARGHRSFDCVLCQTKPRLNQTLSLSTALPNLSSHLRLTVSNYDIRENQSIICYTNSSADTLSSYNPYKFELLVEESRSEEGLPSVFLKRSLVNDVFYLKINDSETSKIDGFNDSVVKLEESLISYNDTGEVKHLQIDLMVNGIGSYWCMGINKVTLLPVFTERIFVSNYDHSRAVKYIVTVQVDSDAFRQQMTYPENIEVGSKLSHSLAKVLNVTDGVIQLKSITNSDAHLVFEVTVPWSHHPLQNNTHWLKMENVEEIVQIRMDFNRMDLPTYSESVKTTSELSTRLRENMFVEVTFSTEMKPDEPLELTTARHTETISEPTRSVSVLPTDAALEVNITASPTETTSPPDTTVLPPTPSEALTILHNLTQHPVHCTQLPHVTSLINTILSSPDAASSEVLRDLDIILTHMILDPGTEEVQSIEPSVAILVGDLLYENPVVGISFGRNNEDFVLNPIKYLNSNGTSDLHSNQTTVYVKINPSVINDNTRVAFVVYTNTIIFAESENVEVNSHVLNVLLSKNTNATITFPKGEFIDIFFKPQRTRTFESEAKTCAFWNLEKEAWYEDGCVLHHKTEDGMDVCRCYHLTHFGEIILVVGSPLPPGHQKALEVISISGCTLSLFGLLVIGVTAIVFKNWRVELGNKILLNLSAALTMNLVVFLLVHGGVGGSSGPDCITIGVLLHYSILACFSWMLVMSGLQVMRLITVLGNKRFTNLLIKACIIGWGMPLVPVIILLAIDPTMYSSSSTMGFDRGFCYPRGAAFYASIAAPVAIIVLTNIVVYIVIICRICSCFGWGALNTGIQRHGIPDAFLAMRRFRTLCFLFFLFGITWTFGFLVQYLFFAYLFCITATIQGFIIFIFLFVIEKKSRGLWKKMWFDAYDTRRGYTSKDDTASELFDTVRLNDDMDVFAQDRSKVPNTSDTSSASRRELGQGGVTVNEDQQAHAPLRKVKTDTEHTYTSFDVPSFLEEEQSRRDSATESRKRSTFQTFK